MNLLTYADLIFLVFFFFFFFFFYDWACHYTDETLLINQSIGSYYYYRIDIKYKIQLLVWGNWLIIIFNILNWIYSIERKFLQLVHFSFHLNRSFMAHKIPKARPNCCRSSVKGIAVLVKLLVTSAKQADSLFAVLLGKNKTNSLKVILFFPCKSSTIDWRSSDKKIGSGNIHFCFVNFRS